MALISRATADPYRMMKRVILHHGGSIVRIPVGGEPDADRIATRGVLWKGRVKMMPGEPHQCHANAASLWLGNSDRSSIITGYAFDKKDGSWRQHSWLLHHHTGNTIETTVRFDKYFGFEMDHDEAMHFADMNF